MLKIRIFSSIFAIELQKCRIFSYFRGLHREICLLFVPPFSSILGSISDPKADIKIGSFFSSIFITILVDFGVILGLMLKDFLFRNGSSQMSKNLKTRETFVKIKGLGVCGHSKKRAKMCLRSR